MEPVGPVEPSAQSGWLDLVPGVIVRYREAADGGGALTFVGAELLALCGVAPARAMAEPWALWQRVAERDREALVAAAAEARRVGARIDLEVGFAGPDDERRWARVVAQPAPAASGVTEWVGLIIDVSDHRRDRELADALREGLERVATGAPLGEVLDLTCRSIERRLPDAASSVLLLDRERNTLRFGAAPTLPTAYMRALEGLAIGPEVGSCGVAMARDVTVISPDLALDPNWRPYLALASSFGLRACWSTPFHGRDGAVAGSFAVYFATPRAPTARDLEALTSAAHIAGIAFQRVEAEGAVRETEERLRQIQKLEAVGQLAGGVAHDFNNLLTVIATSTDFLARGATAAGREDVELIRAATRRAAALTRQLLTFGRRQPWQPTVVDVDHLIGEFAAMIGGVVGERVRVTRHPAPRPATVWIDAASLEQALLNLAVNARDAMPDGGELELRTELADDGRRVELRIHDTGTGMDEATRRRAFEPFFTTKPIGSGSGLGLATTYGTITRAGGTVTVDSAPGRGTTFLISLPWFAGDPAAHPVPGPSLLPDPAPRPRLLVVEDDAGVRRLIARVLDDRGFAVVAVGDGAAALAALEADAAAFAAVLSDVVMPGLTGLQLRDLIMARWPHLPVVLMSGHVPDRPVGQAPSDAPRILAKPFTADELVDAVTSASGATARR